MLYIIFICFVLGTGLCIIGLAEFHYARLGRIGSKATKTLGYVVAIGGVCFISAIFGLSLIFDGFALMCEDTVIDALPSPNGSNVAYLFSRDCGAVTSSGEMAPTVMLRDRSHPMHLENGQIQIRQDWLGRGMDDVVYRGGLSDIKWVSNKHLQIELTSGEPGDLLWNDVKISYKRAKVQSQRQDAK